MLRYLNLAALILGWIQILCAVGLLLSFALRRREPDQGKLDGWPHQQNLSVPDPGPLTPPPAQVSLGLNRKALLLARARERHGSLYIEEPDGTLTPLCGLEELGTTWPPDVR